MLHCALSPCSRLPVPAACPCLPLLLALARSCLLRAHSCFLLLARAACRPPQDTAPGSPYPWLAIDGYGPDVGPDTVADAPDLAAASCEMDREEVELEEADGVAAAGTATGAAEGWEGAGEVPCTGASMGTWWEEQAGGHGAGQGRASTAPPVVDKLADPLCVASPLLPLLLGSELAPGSGKGRGGTRGIPVGTSPAAACPLPVRFDLRRQGPMCDAYVELMCTFLPSGVLPFLCSEHHQVGAAVWSKNRDSVVLASQGCGVDRVCAAAAPHWTTRVVSHAARVSGS